MPLDFLPPTARFKPQNQRRGLLAGAAGALALVLAG